MKPLTDNVSVTGQLRVEDFERLAAAGIKTIINNRPDGEIPMQPGAADLAVAAKDLGLTYHHLPMQGGISPDLIKGSIEAYAQSPTPIVAFCGSGTRSAALWSFAAVKERGVDDVLAAVSAQGYQLEQLRVPLTAFAAS